MDDLPYDPRLKVAAADIRKILEHHNIAGSVVLSSDTHGEFLNHFPTWSGVSIEGVRGVRVRIKEGEDAKATATVKMLVNLRDVLGMLHYNMSTTFEALKREVERTGGEIVEGDDATIIPD